jgi:hypothetical protein
VIGTRTRATLTRYRGQILLVGLAVGLLLGVNASIGRVGSIAPEDLPGAARTIEAAVLLLLGQLSVGYAWRRLAPSLADPVTSMWTFHATQPGKYLPLGVGQAIGQVALARSAGLPTRTAMGAWASHLAMIVGSGVAVGTLVVLVPRDGAIRWLGVVGLAGALVAYRPVLHGLIGFGARFSKRLPAAEDLPSQRSLVEAFVACAVFVVLDGCAFAILLGSGAGDGVLAGTIGAYALAVGISTATPLPAGLGVRELLLVIFLDVGTAPVITASIVLRVTVFAVEVALLVGFSTVRQVRAIRSALEPDG